jgi:hypothetical protein
MRLTKAQTAAHDKATAIAANGRKLTEEEKEFIWTNYHPAANHNTTKTGAFFTPLNLAWEAAVQHGGGGHVIDFCAGIGVLAGMLLRHTPETKVTCIELNPDYASIGRRLVPGADWIEADALTHEKHYDSAISNPPFGRFGKIQFEDAAIGWLANHTARGAILILPEAKHNAPNGWTIHSAPVEVSAVFKTTGIRVAIYDLGRP